jgi:L-asparaginase II
MTGLSSDLMSSGSEPSPEAPWPTHPVLARVWRGAYVESQHRGTWVVVDSAGRVLDGVGDPELAIFARSSIKSVQALPLIESGAAERFGFSEEELTLAVASHDAEPLHTERVGALLARLGLGANDLQCGPQPPGNKDARLALTRAGASPTPLHNNCSGKHAGFLALALHLGVDTARYLDPESDSQRAVRRAVEEVAGVAPEQLTTAIDGCSAPTFRLPLRNLAAAIARVTNPGDLAPARRAACERITAAVAAFPELVAGTRERLCTDLSRATGGRLFPKIGGEAVYVVGERGGDRALALKMDDGSLRGMHPVAVALLLRLGMLSAKEAAQLEDWRRPLLKNWAGLEVGRVEVAE